MNNLFVGEQYQNLVLNGVVSQGKTETLVTHQPVVKLMTDDGERIWLLVSLYPKDPDVAFGLCDLGIGLPECGDVRLSEVEAACDNEGKVLRQDLSFNPDKTILEYTREAVQANRITV